MENFLHPVVAMATDKNGDITIHMDGPLVTVSGKTWNTEDDAGKEIHDTVYNTLSSVGLEATQFRKNVLK